MTGPFLWGCVNSVLNVNAVVAAFNQEKALEGAFSMITNLPMDLFEALVNIAAVVAATGHPAPVVVTRFQRESRCFIGNVFLDLSRYFEYTEKIL